MSTAIKTIEILESKLQGDLAWRKKEMLSLRLLVNKDSTNEPLLLRAGMALLCAHFEGFVKFASKAYIQYVSEQGIRTELLKDNFAALNMKGAFSECSHSDKVSVHSELISKYNSIHELPFKLHNRDAISTHSNPSSKKLKELLLSIGISSDIFETKANYIDKSLLENRHRVVHGDYCNLDKVDFDSTFEIIMKLIDGYEELVIEAADNKNYMKGK